MLERTNGQLFPHALYFTVEQNAPLKKSGFSRRFWGNNNPDSSEPEETEAIAGQSQPGGIRGLISGLLNRKQGRRETLQQQAAMMASPQSAATGALKTAAGMAAPAISAAAGAATAAGADPLAAMRELVRKVGSKPSSGTWISLGNGLVRHAETGLIGMLTNGASKVAGSAAGISTGDPKSHKLIAKMAQVAAIKGKHGLPSLSSMAAPWKVIASLAGSGAKVSPRAFVEKMLQREAQSPTLLGEGSGRLQSGAHRPAWLAQEYEENGASAKNQSNADIARQIIGNTDGVGVYVLPAEVQSKHAGAPIRHIPGSSQSPAVFQLSPHDQEESDYELLDRALSPKILQDREKAQSKGDVSSLEYNIGLKDKTHDQDAELLKKYKEHQLIGEQAQYDPESGEIAIFDPETGEPDEYAKWDWERDAAEWQRKQGTGDMPKEIDPDHEGDMLEHIADKHHESWTDSDQHRDMDWEIQRHAQLEEARKMREERAREQAKKKAKQDQDEENRRKWGRYLRGNYATRAAMAGGRGIYGPGEQYERSFRSVDLDRLRKALG